MKIMGIFLIIVSINGLSADMPVKNLSTGEVMDPGQHGAEKKIWANVLQAYGQFRQTAVLILRDINSVVDLCWAAQKQLESIQTVANRVESIAKYIDKYKYDDIVQLVKDMEEEVFSQSDLLLYSDIPGVKNSFVELGKARNDVIENGANSMRHLTNVSKGFYSVIQNQYKRITGTTESNDAQASINNRSASSVIATHTADQINLDNQAAIITLQTKKLTDQNGAIVPDEMAENNMQLQRNSLIMNYQENEYEYQRIQNLSLLLLEKSKHLHRQELNKKRLGKSFNQD